MLLVLLNNLANTIFYGRHSYPDKMNYPVKQERA